ncbi:kelch-like protein 24 [Biomphalaria glabrata]|uniref:Kelch-like protein 24 n=1 Tax=Biomphalaria glabrata TaxID=6526 RepID=A0A9U8DXX8_BIOGL|nr:kelch-like protein 24 [Biomphalaria glabrata]KAI8732980.1 kelch-like protein 24 [Biomphalaria glabrata]KAI8781548.1 kelch protein 24 [Biomphalaria glabrata]
MEGASSWLQQYYHAMSSGMERLYTSGAHTDTTIIVEEKTFQCHRVILCAISPYFDAMFSSGMKESVSGVVKIEGTDSSVFESILDYIYKGSDSVNEDNAEAILKAACLLQMECLQKRCEEFICKTLTVTNCFERWRLAIWHCSQHLKQQAWRFIMTNFVKISQQEIFLYLEKEELISVIKDDDLSCPNEEFVVESVLKWFQHDLEVRGQLLGDIFPYLRLPLTKPQFLIDILRKYSFVKEHTECHMYIDHAKNFQLLPAHRHDSSSPVTSYRTTSLYEDVLVVISGGESPRPPYIRSKNVLAFGFNSRKWFRLAPLPYDPGIEFATCVHSNDIFVTGGGLYKHCFLRYRSKKDKWSQCRSKLKNGRRRHAMAACGNKIYVIGGYNSELEQGSKVLSSIEEFELGCSEWTEVANLVVPVSSISATSTKDKVLIFGGETNDRTDTASIQCFDTQTHTTSVIAQLPIACKLTRATVCNSCSYVILYNGKIVQFDHRTDLVKVMGHIQNFDCVHYGLVHRRGCLLLLGGQRIIPGPNPVRALVDTMLLYDVRNQRVIMLNDKIPTPRLVDSCAKVTIEKKFLVTEFVETTQNC